jgi:putative membrane protein
MRVLRNTIMSLAGVLLVPLLAGAQAPTAAPALDDAAIVGIFDAANGWDIETGSLAAQKASRDAVKSYGAMLARDHEAVRKQGRDLAAKLGATPTPVPADFALKKNHDAMLAKLRGLSGAEFDKAFLEHEVAFHKAVIDAVTTTFLPAIRNPELKAFVEKVAPAFEAHMKQAENLLKMP